MMVEIILFSLLMVVCWDCRVIKNQGRELYQKVFYVPEKIVLPLAAVIASVLLCSKQRWDYLPYFILLTALPLYLYKRCLFFDAFHRDYFFPHGEREAFILKSDALGVGIVWLYSVLIFSVLLQQAQKLFPRLDTEMGDLIITAIFSSGVLFYLIYKASQRFSGQGFAVNIGLVRNNQPFWKIFGIPFLVGLFFAVCSALIVLVRKSQPSTPLGETLMGTESSLAIFIFFVLALLVAPLFEEIVFRGYFFRVMNTIKGQTFAVVSIALIFALLHVGQYWGDWMAIAMVALMGFALTILRAWTGSTIASTITHYIYNSGVTIIPVVVLILSNPAYFKYQAYYHSYDSETKEMLLKESIDQHPHFIEAYNDLAWLYAEENKNLEQAMSLIEKALAVEPNNVSYLDTKAELLTKLEQYAEAIDIRQGLLKRKLSKEMRTWQLEKINELKMRGMHPQGI